ncbi:hypothetical protein Thiowin_00536 [Thiorhodovibrio winogradskyi]|uniref:Uncharacterized protein n=2 Tax=Thiorhodovibrio winogradskyi TaxID=77007 RepID=A0ABZ0S519_9GAMM
MNTFVEKLRLKEMAEEDIYFAKRDLELIEALHQRQLTQHAPCNSVTAHQQAKVFEDRYAALSKAPDNDADKAMEHGDNGRKHLKSLRKLIDDIWHACQKQHQ